MLSEMAGIRAEIVFTVARVKAQFEDDIGNTPNRVGTGFWVSRGDDIAFITNRHILDPTMQCQPRRNLKLSEVQLEHRRIEDGVAFPETAFFPVQSLDAALRMHPDADCAALMNPQVQKPSNFPLALSIDIKDLADERWLREDVQLMDFASFIGFPGSGEHLWWDQRANHPIARLATIASLPDAPFVNKAIATADVTLVSGMSFSGSSGSPIISHLKAESPWTQHRRPPKVLGIMSGHLVESSPAHPMFQHTGLSYFTRSTSILQLLNRGLVATG
jgi:hypothetical protein